jgi:hypothetical protein
MATGNAAVTGSIPLIQNAVVFTLSGLPEGFDPTASIQNISFQYGTALTDPNLPTPAPTSGVIALGGALLLARRRR